MTEDDTGQRRLSTMKAAGPIAMMVLLFVATIGLALFIAPLYLRLGLQAFGEENASNPLIALYYMVMIIVVTAVVLVLKRFLKKRKRRFLKYILGAAVLISTYAVIWPLLTAAVYGLPPSWEEHDLGIGDPVDAIAPDVVVYAGSFGLIDDDGEVRIIRSGENSSFSVLGDMVIETYQSNATVWTRTGDSFEQRLTIRVPKGSNIGSVDLSGVKPLYTLVEGNQTRVISVDDGSIVLNITGIVSIIPSSGFAYEGDSYFSYQILGGNITQGERTSLVSPIIWARLEQDVTFDGAQEDVLLISTESGLWIAPPGDDPRKVSNRRFADPSLVSLASDEDDYEIVAIKGDDLYVIGPDGIQTWYLTDYEYIMIHHTEPGGELTILSSELLERGPLPETRNDTYLHFASFVLAAGLVALLFWKPKWYLVDMAGILMGAGVLSLIGISLSILPILLFLVLLAVYDFISVYKTKHMLSLAESVVESKLPILLVFPMKAGYKYEEEKDLLDKSRPREALFMGLGDVIIPGTLIVSASTFLAGRGGFDPFGIGPQYIVVLFALLGLFAGYSALMYMVLKGKAHAGLPFLNTGVITGFFIGELIAYGTIVIL